MGPIGVARDLGPSPENESHVTLRRREWGPNITECAEELGEGGLPPRPADQIQPGEGGGDLRGILGRRALLRSVRPRHDGDRGDLVPRTIARGDSRPSARALGQWRYPPMRGSEHLRLAEPSAARAEAAPTVRP